MESWLEKFVEACKEIKAKGVKLMGLPGQGVVGCDDALKCKKCGRAGIFYGHELDNGEFYECASARYCPSCETIDEIVTGCNYAAPYNQKSFLSLMKKKLISDPRFLSCVIEVEGRPCPECKNSTYNYHKDLGMLDFYDNTWTVCINPSCNWQGEHDEKYESSY